MYYVNPKDLMRLFKDYIEEYGDNLTKEEAIEALSDAIDSADFTYGEEEDE